jgi:hypothetical protein
MSLQRLRLLSAGLLGFFLIVNLYLIPSSTQTPRATDLIGAALGLWLMWRLTTRGIRFEPLVALFLFSAIPVVWGLHAFYDGDAATLLLSLRWLLAVPWGYALFLISRDPELRVSLIWGVLVGCLANVVVLAFQYYDFLEQTQNLGLAAQDTTFSYIDTELRASGMEGHPNSSAAILSLAVPLSLYLYYGGMARLWVVGLGFAILLAGSQYTETRSAVLVSLVTAATMLLARRNLGRSLRLVALFAYVGLPVLLWVGPPGGWERWLDTDRLEVNSGERLLSNAAALRIAWDHPFGLGIDEGLRALYEESGIQATHNAFLQVGLAYGSLLAAAIFLLLFFFALQVFAGSRTTPMLEVVLALHVFGLFFFEEHFSAPTFTILMMWFVAASAVPLSNYLGAARLHAKSTARRPQPLQQRVGPVGPKRS